MTRTRQFSLNWRLRSSEDRSPTTFATALSMRCSQKKRLRAPSFHDSLVKIVPRLIAGSRALRDPSEQEAYKSKDYGTSDAPSTIRGCALIGEHQSQRLIFLWSIFKKPGHSVMRGIVLFWARRSSSKGAGLLDELWLTGACASLAIVRRRPNSTWKGMRGGCVFRGPCEAGRRAVCGCSAGGLLGFGSIVIRDALSVGRFRFVWFQPQWAGSVGGRAAG